MGERIEFHRERLLFILNEAHVFKIDEEAELMLRELVNEMKEDGLEDIYNTVRLPFPAIFLDSSASVNSAINVGLLTQDEETIFTQRFIMQKEGLVPSTSVLQSTGFKGEIIPTPTQELVRMITKEEDLGTIIEEEAGTLRYLLGLAVALSTLLKHRGMLEVEEALAYTRPERRRAAKAGQSLPETRVSKIKLGEAGRGQLKAMQDAGGSRGDARISRRAHWVRGHFMRNPSGGLSWRMPHIRGAGPLIKQERHVVTGATEP